MIVRVATPRDLDAIHALVERAYRGDDARRGWTHEGDLLGGQRTDRKALEEVVVGPHSAVLVALDADRLIGCVQVSDEGKGLSYLGMLSVDPTLQTRGWGRALIAAAEAYAVRQFDAARIEMTVIGHRTELIDYYERRGYRPTGEKRRFPYSDDRFGLPRTSDLEFVVPEKPIKV